MADIREASEKGAQSVYLGSALNTKIRKLVLNVENEQVAGKMESQMGRELGGQQVGRPARRRSTLALSLCGHCPPPKAPESHSCSGPVGHGSPYPPPIADSIASFSFLSFHPSTPTPLYWWAPKPFVSLLQHCPRPHVGREGPSPLLCLGCTVPLTPVLEPVADLGGSQTGGLCQFPLFARGGVGVVDVPLS